MDRNTKLEAMDIVQLFLDSIGDLKDTIVPIILESSSASEFDADENDDDLAWAIAEYLNHLASFSTSESRASFLKESIKEDDVIEAELELRINGVQRAIDEQGIIYVDISGCQNLGHWHTTSKSGEPDFPVQLKIKEQISPKYNFETDAYTN